MTVAALIPARLGSRGVPEKNVKRIGTLSLVERAVLCAINVPEIRPHVYLSTDDLIAETQARPLGARIIERPDHLATSETPMAAVIDHALDQMEPRPDILVLLQPTTPSRTWQMVQDAVQSLMRSPEVDSVISVVPVPLTHAPEMVMRMDDVRLTFVTPEPRPTRRQDVTPVFTRDGSFYVFRVGVFEETGSIYGQHCRPYVLRPSESLNIDTQEDWARACALLR